MAEDISSIGATVRALADKEAIREVAHRYVDCAWRKDIAGLVNLFSTDGEMNFGSAGNNLILRGKAELMQGFERVMVHGYENGPFPFVHSHVIELRGDTATGRCYLEARVTAQGKNRIVGGYYHDQYVREGSEWKIRSRAMQTAFTWEE